jgi:hypothetical protein
MLRQQPERFGPSERAYPGGLRVIEGGESQITIKLAGQLYISRNIMVQCEAR